MEIIGLILNGRGSNDGNDWLNTIRMRKYVLMEQLRIPTLLQFHVRLPSVILPVAVLL